MSQVEIIKQNEYSLKSKLENYQTEMLINEKWTMKLSNAVS